MAVIRKEREERDAKAVYFSREDHDDAKLLAQAAEFLTELNRGGSQTLVGINHQSDNMGSRLTLFLEMKLDIALRWSSCRADEDVKIRYLP